MPEFQSAVTRSYPSSAGAPITLADESATTKTLVRSDQQQFGLAFGASSSQGEALVAATRPGEWLLLGDAAAVSSTEAAVDRSGFTSVIPFTHGRSMFRVTGEPAASMLEKVCSIDWSDAMTPNGAVVSASVALTTCDIIRQDRNATPSYLLICDRSFGQYLFDSLHDAANEFGVTVE